MKRKILLIGFISLLTALVLSACTGNDESTAQENSDMEQKSSENMNMNEEESDSMEEGIIQLWIWMMKQWRMVI